MGHVYIRKYLHRMVESPLWADWEEKDDVSHTSGRVVEDTRALVSTVSGVASDTVVELMLIRADG